MKVVSVEVGPLAAASATAIALSQTASGAAALSLDGASGTGADDDGIATSQAVGGAGDLTLDGVLVASGVAQLGTPSPVTITSAGNDSGITFTVYGTAYTPGGGPVSVVETVTGGNISVVSTRHVFQTVTRIEASGAAAANVEAGRGAHVATLDEPRQVSIDSTGNDSGITFTVFGTDWNGNPVSETITGGNIAAVETTRDFATVTAIWPSGATAGDVTVGTNGVASSRPIRLDDYADAPVLLQIDVDGTVDYTVQGTLDDPTLDDNSRYFETTLDWADVIWIDHSTAALVNASTSLQGEYAIAPKFVRVTLNSGAGSLRFSVHQAGAPQ